MKRFSTFIVLLGMATATAFSQPPYDLDATVSVDEGAVIHQVGDHQTAEINQSGSPQAAAIYQEGPGIYGNTAVINQNLGVVGNEGYIQQVGDNNRARLDFAGEGYNTGVVFQHGEGHNIGVTVVGINNTVDIRQESIAGHRVENAGLGLFSESGDMFTWGDNNIMNVVQHGDQIAHLVTTPNGESHVQAGNFNLIDVWQDGSDQLAELQQIGDGNIIHVKMEGPFRNTTQVMQFGDDHSASVDQLGAGNSVNIHQQN